MGAGPAWGTSEGFACTTPLQKASERRCSSANVPLLAVRIIFFQRFVEYVKLPACALHLDDSDPQEAPLRADGIARQSLLAH